MAIQFLSLLGGGGSSATGGKSPLDLSSITNILGGATKFISNAFTKTTDSEGMLKNWRGDADGGLAEVVRWTKNNGQYPAEEAKAVKTLIAEKGLENVIGKQTRYGDTLKLDDVIKKFSANGFSDEADLLRQYQRQSLSGQTVSLPTEAFDYTAGEVPKTLVYGSFFDELQAKVKPTVISNIPKKANPALAANGNKTTTALTDTTKKASMNMLLTVALFVPAVIALLMQLFKKGNRRRY